MIKTPLLKKVMFVILALIIILVLIFLGVYLTRIQSVSTLTRLTSYDDGYDLYKIDIKYNYKLEDLMRPEIKNDEELAKIILNAAIPYIPIKMETPDYSCSAFKMITKDGDVLMGRNYDFDIDTSALLVCCSPKDGYRSVGMAALDHVSVHKVSSIVDKISTLPSTFICLDGMNEKGVAISILMLDSPSVKQETEKPDVFTTLAVRLVLDRAASTGEAVDLLRAYDMYAVSRGDYHFFITDAKGDSRVIEYDPHSETRELVDTPIELATNFYEIYKDKVLPDQYNDIYGHGRERYDTIEKILNENKGSYSPDLAWKALEAAQQLPKRDQLTSNTQWSVVYNVTKQTADVTLRRKWGDITYYSLTGNTAVH